MLFIVCFDTVTKGTCEELPDPLNGTRFFGTTYPEFGSEALFQCDPGFVLIGHNITQCVVAVDEESQVKWSNDAPPVCVGMLNIYISFDITPPNSNSCPLPSVN